MFARGLKIVLDIPVRM